MVKDGNLVKLRPNQKIHMQFILGIVIDKKFTLLENQIDFMPTLENLSIVPNAKTVAHNFTCNRDNLDKMSSFRRNNILKLDCMKMFHRSLKSNFDHFWANVVEV